MSSHDSLVAGRYRPKGDPDLEDGIVEVEAEDTRLGRRVMLVMGDPGVAADVIHEQATARDADARILDGGSVDDRSFLVLQPPEEVPAAGAATAPSVPPTEVMPSLAGEATAAATLVPPAPAPAARTGRLRAAETMLALGLVVLIAAVTLVLLWPGGGTATTPVETDPAATATTVTPTTTLPPTTTSPPSTAAPTTEAPRETRDDGEKGDDKDDDKGGGKRDRSDDG
jgi:hypothetical protein